MTTSSHISRRSFLGLAGAGAGAVLLGACGNSSSTKSDANAKQTINWWHIGTNAPLSTLWPEMAKQYMAQHPNITLKLTAIENDSFKAKLSPAIQAGSPPDLFHSWGGGYLQDQVDAGMVKDLTKDTSDIIGDFSTAALSPYKINGKMYGMPYDLGMVGFWYNKDLFAKANISSPPTTWGDFLNTVKQLKAAGMVPLGLSEGDKWPGHYYWAYLAIRTAGLDALQNAAKSKNFNNPDLVAAGQHLKDLLDLKPFQNGFLAAKYSDSTGQAGQMGNGKVAMELMGQWAPSVEASSAADKKGQGDKIAFFTFPAVEGGKGNAKDAFGGGGGFAVGKNAPSGTIDFVKFLVNAANERTLGASGAVLPVVKGTQDSVKDPMQQLVAKTLASASGFQLYLDQAYVPAIGQQVNDSVADLMAGKATPGQVCKAITDAASK
jgi:raffinose/stachyose/melibiose transport system substrate-binding protein